MWAVAEICWHDASGAPHRLPATLEDTSASGACVRVQHPVALGSRVTIKWHREQFWAVARNCRKDGNAFLLGVKRETRIIPSEPTFRPTPSAKLDQPETPASTSIPTRRMTESFAVVRPALAQQKHLALGDSSTKPDLGLATEHRAPAKSRAEDSVPHKVPHIQLDSETQGSSPRPERKVMQPKTIFPHFWRRPQDGDALAKPIPTEVPMNKPTAQTAEAPTGSRGEQLSYEDIYRAAGILSPGSGYGIHKVVDMMNNERIRDLSKDVKRASVLMALDAAGISPDDLLTDATRRQNALNSYEAGQKKQLEDFEARKAQENGRIEEEMEKIRMHYAQRIQKNLDQVAREKDALRNWQMAMQHESQRISDVIELCAKQPAVRTGTALAAAAGAQDSSSKADASPGDAPRAVPRTSL